ncbi:MAG: MgtC/SapB family protein [Clostridiaceae bacterium]|jgi:putative Mg2+ transporter-C (MgtC) family protein|nr:MgtC/SapB family protein [Clostridiaceae bacterium]
MIFASSLFDPMNLSNIQLNAGQIVTRLLVAMLIGAVIGTEREFTHRPAGIRTYTLVSLGSCAVMITSQLIFLQYSQHGAMPDPGRLSAQVIAGVGFLGAGTILREGVAVKGLTTAAGLWAVACLGIAIGAGYYIVGGVGAVCLLVTLVVLEWVQRRIMHRRNEIYSFRVLCDDQVKALESIYALSAKNNGRLRDIQLARDEESSSKNVAILFRIDFSGRRAIGNSVNFFKDLSIDKEVASVKMERLNM